MRATIARAVGHFTYTPLLATAAAVSFGKLIVYAQLIGVEQFGALGKMLLLSSLFGLAGSLGLQSVVSRDVPALFARARVRRGMRMLVHTTVVTTAVAAVCLIATVLGLSPFDLSGQDTALGVLHGWAQQAYLVAAYESRSRLAMMRYARDMAGRSVAIALVGGVAGGLIGDARNVVLAEALGTLVCLAVVVRAALRRANLQCRWLTRAARFDWRALPWGAALTLFAGAAVMFFSVNLDRWLAAEILRSEEFGWYAFAWLALVAAQSVQALLNSGLLPLLARQRALGRARHAFEVTRAMSILLLTAGLVLFAPAIWSAQWVVERWMPQYQHASPLLAPLLLAAVFRVSDFWSSFLVVIDRERALLTGQVGAVVLAGAAYAGWLYASPAGPSPRSLAWLAVATALASHLASAAAAYGTVRAMLAAKAEIKPTKGDM
jgi:O-antigen/teichoic acid export membrane protein